MLSKQVSTPINEFNTPAVKLLVTILLIGIVTVWARSSKADTKNDVIQTEIVIDLKAQLTEANKQILNRDNTIGDLNKYIRDKADLDRIASDSLNRALRDIKKKL